MSTVSANTATVPARLLAALRCPTSSEEQHVYDPAAETITFPGAGTNYSAQHGIPSMVLGGPASQSWNAHRLDKVKMMNNNYYLRAKGDLPEKEASKSYARLLERRGLYLPGDTLLDLGCASGHFLRSFRRLLDENILYTGLDTDAQSLLWGKEVFGVDNRCNFVHGDCTAMPLKSNSFDTIVVNLFHFFPNVEVVLREAMRVARKWIIWRTPIGEINYIIKEIYTQSFKELGVLTPDRDDFEYSIYMLYTKQYIEELVEHLCGSVDFIERDTDFGDFDNTVYDDFKHVTATKTVAGMQVNGNLILDWHYIGIRCRV